MKFEWDAEKAAANLAKHGVGFEAVRDFDMDEAVTIEDTRHDHGEERFRSFGYIGTPLHVLVFTWRGRVIRVISLRKANRREEARYG